VNQGSVPANQDGGGATNVGILLYDHVQVTDFTGPYDVFVLARPAGQPDPSKPPPLCQVFTVAQKETVTCWGGLRVRTDYRLDQHPPRHPPIEILVVPGGLGVFQVRGDPTVMAWIESTAKAAQLAASVCIGALLLGELGLFNGLPATTHWSYLDELRRIAPSAEVLGGVRYADAGKIISSAGISAGIDMALHVLERLHGREVADQTARILEYDSWEGGGAAEPGDHAGTP
jgi:transcriptional regulator GlxA family with amidase domain